MKRCKWCGEVKPLDDFYKHPQTRDGRDPRCKKCISVYQKRRATVPSVRLAQRQKATAYRRMERRLKMQEHEERCDLFIIRMRVHGWELIERRKTKYGRTLLLRFRGPEGQEQKFHVARRGSHKNGQGFRFHQKEGTNGRPADSNDDGGQHSEYRAGAASEQMQNEGVLAASEKGTRLEGLR